MAKFLIIYDRRGGLGDLHLPTFGTLTFGALTDGTVYKALHSLLLIFLLLISYMAGFNPRPDILSPVSFRIRPELSLWMVKGPQKKAKQLYASLLKLQRKIRREIGKFLLVFSNAPEDGGECLSGHCAHRKQGTVGVLSLSIVSFH